jgi:hypothetical protein
MKVRQMSPIDKGRSPNSDDHHSVISDPVVGSSCCPGLHLPQRTDMDQHSSPSAQRAIPTPISVSEPAGEHTMLLPSAIPILRSFAALQGSPPQDHRPDASASAKHPGAQTTPPTPAVPIFRTPSRTRVTNGSYRTPGKSSDSKGYGATRSVPPTPTPGGTFRSFRRERSVAPDVRRLSEMRIRQGAREDDDGQRDNFLGDEEDEAAAQRYESSTFQRRNRPSLHHGTRSPSANSDGSAMAEDENQTPFSLPRLFRTVSRQASSVFTRGGGGGREYDDDVRQQRRTPGHSRRQSSTWSPRGGLDGSGEAPMEPVAEDGIRVWYS